MTRTDIHRPAVIEPADYDFVAFDRVKIEGLADCYYLQAQRELIRQHMARTGGRYSSHAHGGNCHICGAYALSTALFWHRPSNVYVRTGLDCADKLGCEDAEMFRRVIRDALEATAGKRKAEAVLAKAGLERAWAIYRSDPDADRREEETIRDMVGKLVKYGSFSEKQTAFLRTLVDRIERRAEIEAQRAAEAAAPGAPVPACEKRITVQGKVLTIKRPGRLDFGPPRMLVQHRDGWKVWGTLPGALDSITAGAEVCFDAAVKPSDKDKKFGFFSRPTKAKLLTEKAAV